MAGCYSRGRPPYSSALFLQPTVERDFALAQYVQFPLNRSQAALGPFGIGVAEVLSSAWGPCGASGFGLLDAGYPLRIDFRSLGHWGGAGA